MGVYRIAVCEDERFLREELAETCRDILSGLGVEYELDTFSCAQELQDALMVGTRFDIMCLDILMPGQNGMELAQEIRRYDDRVSLLFITSSTDHLLEGYSVRPIQYLLKPVSRKELEAAVRTDLRLNHQPRILRLSAGGRIVVLELRDILYLEGRDHGTYVVTERDEQFFRLSLQDVEKQLPAEEFCRCHRSFVVNLSQIRNATNHAIVLDGDRWIPIGRGSLNQFRQQFNAYLNAGNI